MMKSQILTVMLWGMALFGAIGILMVVLGLFFPADLEVKLGYAVVGIIFVISALAGFWRIREMREEE